MQLEALCITLGIVDHIPALSEWRDGFLREKAEEMQVLAAELTAVRAELTASQATLVEHQAHADRLVAAATVAIDAGDSHELRNILQEVSLFGAVREAAKRAKEITTLQARIDEIKATP